MIIDFNRYYLFTLLLDNKVNFMIIYIKSKVKLYYIKSKANIIGKLINK